MAQRIARWKTACALARVSLAWGSIRLSFPGAKSRAPCVIDARGMGRVDGLTIGYQKFLGLVVRFERPHGQPYPIIMDAKVKQRDGYRFVYTLPFTHDTMPIEDTYYSDTASIDTPTLRQLCLDYAQERGWEIAEIVREERGVLAEASNREMERWWPIVERRNRLAIHRFPLIGYSHEKCRGQLFSKECADAKWEFRHARVEFDRARPLPVAGMAWRGSF